MLLKLSWYKLKLEYQKYRMFSVIPMVTTKEIVTEYTKGNQNGIKTFHYKKSTKYKKRQ